MEKKRDSSCMGSSPYRAYDNFLSSAGRARAGAAPLTLHGNLTALKASRGSRQKDDVIYNKMVVWG